MIQSLVALTGLASLSVACGSGGAASSSVDASDDGGPVLPADAGPIACGAQSCSGWCIAHGCGVEMACVSPGSPDRDAGGDASFDAAPRDGAAADAQTPVDVLCAPGEEACFGPNGKGCRRPCGVRYECSFGRAPTGCFVINEAEPRRYSCPGA